MATGSLVASPTSATVLTLNTPAQTTPSTAFVVTGTYQGTPQALDYNFGSGWIQASSVTFSGGIFSFTVPYGLYSGTYTSAIRDHNKPSVSAKAASFVVQHWSPTDLDTSPGAKPVFEFNASNASIVPAGAGSTVLRVANSLDRSQYLTVKVATGGNPVKIANNSGADGTRRILAFHATKINAGVYDPSTDWLGAGGVGGSAGAALVNLANSSNLSKNGSFTTIIALKIDKSYSYAAGPIWGSLASPGPLQYAQIRYNGSSGLAGGQVFDSLLVGANAQGTISAGWHVMTMIKNVGTITYRLDGKQIATASVTSTRSFTASDFMIGGGFPPPSSPSAGKENGVPPPYIGEFQAYSGVVAGRDLQNAEKLAGTSIGLSLSPTLTPPLLVAGPSPDPTTPTPDLPASVPPDTGTPDTGSPQATSSGPLAIADTTTGQTSSTSGTPYNGPVAGLQNEYISITSDNVNISAATPDWFIHTGTGNDAIALSSGTNVLDGGTGSNFLTGGGGTDIFFVDDRGATSDFWSTVTDFHAGESATIWGVTPSAFSLVWQDGQGAAGHTGLTLHAMAAGKPIASLTLAGYTTSDLSDGRLSVSFGTDAASASPYMYIHGNG